eukprot:3881648-Rhodomonas_salina.1
MSVTSSRYTHWYSRSLERDRAERESAREGGREGEREREGSRETEERECESESSDGNKEKLREGWEGCDLTVSEVLSAMQTKRSESCSAEKPSSPSSW